MHELRLLTHAVTIEASDERTAARLAFLTTPAEQVIPLRHRCRYALRETASGVELSEEGWDFAEATTADHAIELLEARIEARVLDYLERGGWLPLQAALARVDGARLLLLGTPAWRAQLAARLLLAGGEVEGDALALVRGGEVVAWPRCLRVDAALLGAVPELGRFCQGRPSSQSSSGRRLWSVAPPAFGVPWRIAPGPIDAVVIASSGARGGRREPGPVASVALLAASGATAAGAKVVRETSSLLRGAQAWSVDPGEIDVELEALRAIAASAAIRAVTASAE